jgi:glutamate 5-kinase
MRVVVKIGSNILAGESGLDEGRMRQIASDVASICGMGNDVVIVSSGAIAAGMKKLGLKKKPKEIRLKQAAASIGQSSLMWAYEKVFSERERKVAQVLLTREDLSDRKRYLNAKNTILTLLSYGVIPVVNENDTVATDEIMFGDNDHLASMIASLIDAERLVILSDVEGLYTEDPKKNPGAELIGIVHEITPDMEAAAGGKGSIFGTGGMYSKLLAAKKAVLSGIAVNIVSGRKAGILPMLFKGGHAGTEFKAGKGRLSAKKEWIAHGVRTKGALSVDDGAKRALLEHGRSLLPSGVVSVEGNFKTGDAVYCLDSKGRRVAKGLANYSSEEIEKIMGKKTSDIEKALGYRYSDEVIHRDNLVVLG